MRKHEDLAPSVIDVESVVVNDLFSAAAHKDAPSLIPPVNTNGPSKNARTARSKANGLAQPVWPPAPADNKTRPSAPAANTLWAGSACLSNELWSGDPGHRGSHRWQTKGSDHLVESGNVSACP